MGVIDDKKNVLTEIGAFNSVKEGRNIPDETNSLSSINNSKESLPFIMDIIGVLAGTAALKASVGELMTGFVREVEPELKDELTKQTIQYNADDELPTTFIDSGIDIPVKDIDSYSKLKTDPATQVGGLIYSDNTDTFDRKAYEAIQNPGTEVESGPIKIKYDEEKDTFNYKPIIVGAGVTIGVFLSAFIASLVLVDEKEFTSKVIDSMFGTVTADQDKSLNDVITETKIQKTLDKVIKEESDLTISDSELTNIENDAEKKKNGVEYVDLGCGLLENKLTLDSIQDLLDTTLNSTDPLTVGDAYYDLVASGFEDSSPTAANKNKNTIEDGYFKKVINTISSTLLESVTTTPQIRTLIGISTAFKNNGTPELGDPVDDIANQKNLMGCLSKKTKSLINEFMFNNAKKEMSKLVKPVVKKIMKEKINNYFGIIKSLTGFSV